MNWKASSKKLIKLHNFLYLGLIFKKLFKFFFAVVAFGAINLSFVALWVIAQPRQMPHVSRFITKEVNYLLSRKGVGYEISMTNLVAKWSFEKSRIVLSLSNFKVTNTKKIDKDRSGSDEKVDKALLDLPYVEMSFYFYELLKLHLHPILYFNHHQIGLSLAEDSKAGKSEKTETKQGNSVQYGKLIFSVINKFGASVQDYKGPIYGVTLSDIVLKVEEGKSIPLSSVYLTSSSRKMNVGLSVDSWYGSNNAVLACKKTSGNAFDSCNMNVKIGSISKMLFLVQNFVKDFSFSNYKIKEGSALFKFSAIFNKEKEELSTINCNVSAEDVKLLFNKAKTVSLQELQVSSYYDLRSNLAGVKGASIVSDYLVGRFDGNVAIDLSKKSLHSINSKLSVQKLDRTIVEVLPEKIGIIEDLKKYILKGRLSNFVIDLKGSQKFLEYKGYGNIDNAEFAVFKGKDGNAALIKNVSAKVQLSNSSIEALSYKPSILMNPLDYQDFEFKLLMENGAPKLLSGKGNVNVNFVNSYENKSLASANLKGDFFAEMASGGLNYNSIKMKVDGDIKASKLHFAENGASIGFNANIQDSALTAKVNALDSVFAFSKVYIKNKTDKLVLSARANLQKDGSLGNVSLDVNEEKSPIFLRSNLHFNKLSISKLTISKAAVFGSEFSGEVKFGNNSIDAYIDGNVVDYLQLLPILFAETGGNDKKSDNFAFNLHLKSKSVLVSKNFNIDNLRLDLATDGSKLKNFYLRGEFDKTGEIAFTTVGQNPIRFNAYTNNIGVLLKSFDITDLIDGGRVSIDASYENENYLNARIIAKDFDILKEKVTVLESDSDEGASEGLPKEDPQNTAAKMEKSFGVDKLDAKASYNLKLSTLNLKDSYLRNDLAKVTIDGQIDFSKKSINLSGNFVPLSVLNAFFAKVPIVGTILGGKHGIIAISYKVTGDLKAPKVSINHFSALTPGILRSVVGN